MLAHPFDVLHHFVDEGSVYLQLLSAGKIISTVKQSRAPTELQWHLVVTQIQQQGLSIKSRHLLFRHILVFWFGFVDLLLPLLVHLLLQILLFSSDSNMEIEIMKTRHPFVFVWMCVRTVCLAKSYFSQMSLSFLSWALWHSSAMVVNFSTS